MVNFDYTVDFELDEKRYRSWIEEAVDVYGYEIGELNYHFLSDDELLDINIEYLDHDTYTDIISFDYTLGKLISGDIFISIDRVRENSLELDIMFHVELLRVMCHGVLHYMGYQDKTDADKTMMRSQEDIFMNLFNKVPRGTEL